MNHPSLVAFVVLASLAAGCAGAAPSPAAEVAGPTTQDVVATVEVLVLDEERVPLAGAAIEVEGTGLQAATDPQGLAIFERVPAGQHRLLVAKQGYAEQALTLQVVGALERLHVVLARLESHVPFQRTFLFEGHYDCAHEIPIWSGDCMIAYEAATGQQDALTSEASTFRFLVGPRWATIWMELPWESSANNQLEGMHFYLEHVTGLASDHSVKVGRADGAENPLRFRVHQGEPGPGADLDDEGRPHEFPPEGTTAQTRAFPRGRLHSESCTLGNLTIGECTLGLGVGLNLRFTAYATVFYNQRGPDGFTAVP